jgi:hypothetical protein
MKSTLRSQIAAVALLAPLGAAFVATPAAAQQGPLFTVQFTTGGPTIVAPAAPRIERFVLSMEGRINPGDELRFRMIGTPNARASVESPGVLRGLAMTEREPGVYVASYVVRPRDDRNAFTRAVATLDNGHRRLTANVDVVRDRDDRQARRDTVAPQISHVTPENGDRLDDRGRVRISARVSDEGSGVESVTLRLDGRDVSRRLRVEGDSVRYRDDLPLGRHTAELVVRDRAGNVTRHNWTFDVVDRDRRGHRGDDWRYADRDDRRYANRDDWRDGNR